MLVKLRTTSSAHTYNVAGRLLALRVGVFLIVAIIVVRLFTVQVLSHQEYTALAEGQRSLFSELVPKRGTIYASDLTTPDALYPLGTNKEVYNVYAVPHSLKGWDIYALAKTLKEIVPETDIEEVYRRITKDFEDPYEPLLSKINKQQADAVEAKMDEMNIGAGIGLTPEYTRTYPEGSLAANVLGYLGYNAAGEQAGVGGVEDYYDDILKGRAGSLTAEKDTAGRFIPLGEKVLDPAEDGADLVLSIDRTVQFKVEEALKKYAEKFTPESASAIFMNPETGEIMAMTSWPDFDPNEYNKAPDVSVFTNTAISNTYEPGSIWKPLVVAAALDSKTINTDTTFYDNGSIQVNGYTINNAVTWPAGDKTAEKILQESSNVGMVQVALALGKPTLQQYVDRFHLNTKTDIDLVGEASSSIDFSGTWRDADIATAGFGQGRIVVTPIKMLTASAALVNGGYIVKPHVVKEVRHANGSIERPGTQVMGQAVSTQTAETMRSMLVSSVDNGVAHGVAIPGYSVGGKTGTAQVASVDARGYDPNNKITSFVGFFPGDSPRVIGLVTMRNAKGGAIWGTTTSAPVFKEIEEFLVNYLQIPPNRSK